MYIQRLKLQRSPVNKKCNNGSEGKKMEEEKARVGTIPNYKKCVWGKLSARECQSAVRPVSAFPPHPHPPPGGETGRSIRAKLAEGPEGAERGHNSSIKTTHKKIQRFGGFSKCSAQSEIIVFFLLYSRGVGRQPKSQFLGSCCTYSKSEHTVGKRFTRTSSLPGPFFEFRPGIV